MIDFMLTSDLIKLGYFSSIWHTFTFKIVEVSFPSNQLKDLQLIKNFIYSLGIVQDEYFSLSAPEPGDHYITNDNKCIFKRGDLTYTVTITRPHYDFDSQEDFNFPPVASRWLYSHSVSTSYKTYFM